MAEPPEERDAVFSGNLTEQETADGKGNWSLGKWAELLLILAWSSSWHALHMPRRDSSLL